MGENEINRPMEHILGFTRSHWMPPPPQGECSYDIAIAAAAAMVDNFGRKHITLTKNYFQLANIRWCLSFLALRRISPEQHIFYQKSQVEYLAKSHFSEYHFCTIFTAPQCHSRLNVRFCPIGMIHSTLGHLIISGCFFVAFYLQLRKVCLFVLCPY